MEWTDRTSISANADGPRNICAGFYI